MKKPIFRWVIGNNSLPRGLAILSLSISNAKKIYKDKFDWYICYNTNDDTKFQKIKEIADKNQVKLFKQSWDSCPIPDQLPKDYPEGLEDHSTAGGSMWKYCPCRIDKDVHEIICDNDIVLVKEIDEINQFLSQEKVLLAEDCRRFFGRYADFHKREVAYNSGFMGLPPNYDFENKIFQTWNKTQFTNLSYGDEQGLITLVLSQEKFILLSTKVLPILATPIFSEDNIKSSDGWLEYTDELWDQFLVNCKGYHFVGANRKQEQHIAWNQFKNRFVNQIKLI